MFIESGRFELWNTSMRLIDDVRPPENIFWILIESKLFDLHNTLIRASPWKQIEAFMGSLWSGKERHSNDKTKRGHNSYYYLGRNSLIFKTCQYS